MDIKIEKLPKAEIKLNVSLSKEEFDAYFEKAFLTLSENLEIKGFRKGKAPKDLAEKAIGKEKILVEAGDLAVQKSYVKAIEQNDLEPISSPEVKITNMGEGMSFEARFFVMPKINLPDYKKIASRIKKEEASPKEREIEGTLNWVRRSRAKFTVKLSPASKGDFVEIEYWSEDLPEIGEDKKKKDSFILGEGHFFGGFEEVIPGMKAGEEKRVELDIPKDHSYKKVAGKKIKFGIIVKSVQNVEFPELNDEFAKTLGNFESMEALKNNIREGIKSEKEKAEIQNKRTEAVAKIAEGSEVEIPPILVEREKAHMLADLKQNVLETARVSFEEYLKQVDKTQEDIDKMLQEEAGKKVKTFLVLREIAKLENISVSDEEADEEVNKTIKNYPTAEEAQKALGVDLGRFKDYTKEVLRTEKTFKIIENLIK